MELVPTFIESRKQTRNYVSVLLVRKERKDRDSILPNLGTPVTLRGDRQG